MTKDLPNACWLPLPLKQIIDNLPDGATTFIKHYERGNSAFDVSFQYLSPAALKCVISFLCERQKMILQKRSVEEIVSVLDLAAERWLDPSYKLRQQAIEQISIITGFSPAMIAHSIYLEQISSRGAHLMKALVNELGDPGYLDGFRRNPKLGGFTRALGPGLIGAIFSSNIPALPHLEIMRAFLVKAACLGRVSAGEPIFLSLYAQTLAEIDPDIASCLAVIYWEHGDQESERLFLESIDYLVAYGGNEQIVRLMEAKPPSLEVTWHGHRMGFAYICREALIKNQIEELADKVSYDYTIFDGHACLCPQICFVEEGGEISPNEFAKICADKMSTWITKLPPRSLDLSEASRKFRLRELYLMQESMGEPVKVVAAPEDYSFMVVMETVSQFKASPGERFLRIVPVDGLADVEEIIKPMQKYLQCAALAHGTGQFPEAIYNEFASWGVTRIVPPGIMGTPSMMWHHDGIMCLGKMLTWCDNELVLPEKLLADDVNRYSLADL
ncbi:MAG: acyl-CoA reductase [Acidobacteriota bacterium]